MKRLFQRSASSTPVQPPSRDDNLAAEEEAGHKPSPDKGASVDRSRRSYSPERIAAVFKRGSSPEKLATKDLSQQVKEPELATPAHALDAGTSALHRHVLTYVTSLSSRDQQAALRAIHTSMVTQLASNECGMPPDDTDRLIGVCSQRFRVLAQRKLDTFIAARPKPGDGPSILISDDENTEEIIITLEVLHGLFHAGEDPIELHKSVILVVSERIPSTLVKMLKALSNATLASEKELRFTKLALTMLSKLVRFPETVSELIETSTLHRIFNVKLRSRQEQVQLLEIISKMLSSVPGPLWDRVIGHFTEYRCLLELPQVATGLPYLQRVILIVAQVLSAASTRGVFSLHALLRQDEFYAQVFTAFESVFRGTCTGMDDEESHQSLRSALAQLCHSGGENNAVMSTGNDDCFVLCADRVRKSARSSFNSEAFALLCQVIELLHIEVQEVTNNDSARLSVLQRQECLYVQEVGQLVVANPGDYVFIEKSGITTVLLRRLHMYPEVTRLAVGSVLSAIAIEASIIPHRELRVVAQLIDPEFVVTDKCGETPSDLSVLLLFLINLLRFDDMYQSIFRSTGLLDSIVKLFRSQAMQSCAEDIRATRINVAHPTGLLKLGFSEDFEASAEADHDAVEVDEKSLLLQLSSHCRQSSTVRKHQTQREFDHSVFERIIELLIILTNNPGQERTRIHHEPNDKNALLEMQFLESLCVLLCDKRYQESALRLWDGVLRSVTEKGTQKTATYNVINCFLQSVRYVALPLYYEGETDITFAFKGSASLLYQAIRWLDELVRPNDSKLPREVERSRCNHQDRVLAGLIKCDAIPTCLAVLCTLTRVVRVHHDGCRSAFSSLLRVLHLLTSSSAFTADQLERRAMYGFIGDTIHRYLVAAYENSSVATSDSQLGLRAVLGLLGWSIDDCHVSEWGEQELIADANRRRLIKNSSALEVALQIVSLWGDQMQSSSVESVLLFIARLLESPENASKCAQAGLCEVLLRCFASDLTCLPHGSRGLSTALLDTSSPYHAHLLSVIRLVAAVSIPSSQVARWINIIINAASARTDATPASTSAVSSMLTLFVDGALSRATQNVPAIQFEASHDGFAQMQIPEVLSRQSAMSSQHLQAQSASSSSQVLAAKTWPPSDGYTALIWMRIDATETKEERERQYWDLLMMNKCVLCKNVLRDESSLKCSHRACKACHEALLNHGAECVVCNPPTFFLFRFRSGDGKSVSELFVRGSKILMRTSAGSKTGIGQFTHPALSANRWYHIAIVHTKQRFQSSQATLYIDGIPQECVKVSYPSSTASGQPLSGLIGIPAQARRVSSARWSIGPLYLLDDALSGHLINAVFAAGPKYSGLFSGSAGNNELTICTDHLQIDNLLLLDEYTKDPMRTLIESVEAVERTSKSSILRGSLSVATAASSTAAAIVNDIKSRNSSGSSVFSRVPSTVTSVCMPIAQERVLLVYCASDAVDSDLSVLACAKLDGRPLAHLLGGASTAYSPTLVDKLNELCGSGARIAFILLEVAKNEREVEAVLELLWCLLRESPESLIAMEADHGYGVVNYLLHQKPAGVLSERVLQILFRIVGIEFDDESFSSTTVQRDSATRNLHAMQHFIFDHSLWQQAPAQSQRRLFSTLYACLMAGGDDKDALIRERNRAQLQSLSLVRQLLYVFLDAGTDEESLRVIADLILVCLTANSGSSNSSSREAFTEENFAEVASFLACTLSRDTEDHRVDPNGDEEEESVGRDASQVALGVDPEPSTHAITNTVSPVARLCLSPRGKTDMSSPVFTVLASVKQAPDAIEEQATPGTANSNARSFLTQQILLQMLTKAVQKHDLKENRDRDEVDGLYIESSTSEPGTGASSSSTNGVASAAQRLQLQYASRITGFRKILSPRWISFFLVPAATVSTSMEWVSSQSVIAALKLLAALLSRPKYESAFRKEGYYRFLAQGLPCDRRTIRCHPAFPFEQMWYTLFCIMLGPPVDGIPHNVEFEMFYLTKDFALNMQRDRVMNASILCVMLTLCRRHYHDAVAFESLKAMKISPECSILSQVHHALYCLDEGPLYHLELVDFLGHCYEMMPAFRYLLTFSVSGGSNAPTNSMVGSSGSGHVSGITSTDSKLRGDFLDELSLVACSAARAEVLLKYMPIEKKVLQELLHQKRELNGFEFATCAIQVAEVQASDDDEGEDPFQHLVAQRSIKFLATVLCDYLVHHTRGASHVEAFFEHHCGVAMTPAFHAGLQLRFQTLVMMSLIDQVRARFADDSCLAENKSFAPNVKDFMALAVQSMHVWQRAQHGDACPKLFACTGDKIHFAGGPFALLELALFVLGENTAVTASVSIGSSSMPSSSTFGQLIQDKLKAGKTQKRRHTIRNMILGKVPFSSTARSAAEVEGLASSMYKTVNAVILHVLQGHGSEVSDDECEMLLQLIHIHRDVVLSQRNCEDKEFFVCLGRFLLQLLGDKGHESDNRAESSLQDLAAHVWIDMMELQRSSMVELLTVEIRRAGGAPYTINLMKNGFDVLSDCRQGGDTTRPQAITSTAAFLRFKGWLDVVGPPLQELENTLDRVFVRRMVESKEVVRDGWSVFHKQVAHADAKEIKRFKAKFDWLVSMESDSADALRKMQQTELHRQLKWRQDHADRQKFHARQWQRLRQDLLDHVLREDEASVKIKSSSFTLLQAVLDSSRIQRRACDSCRQVWQLDAIEGPARMRKRLVMKLRSASDDQGSSNIESRGGASPAMSSDDQSRPRRRRYSDSDILLRASQALTVATATNAATSHRQASHTAADEKRRSMPGKPMSRRVSFENLLHREGERSRRKDSGLSDAGVASGEEDDGRERLSTGKRQIESDAVDEKLRPLLVPGDEILDMFDCLRIDGMDACPGVFLLCSDHLYIVDNYQLASAYGSSLPSASHHERPQAGANARVIEVSRDLPTKLERRLSLRFQLPSSMDSSVLPTPTGGVLTPGGGGLTVLRSSFTHQCRFWAYEDIVELHKRRHQLRHVALELFAHDGRNYLITFESPQQREQVFHSLIAKCPNVRGAANGLDRIAASGDLYSHLRKLLRQNMTERWIAREISNFEYLMHLNTLAGRSYNDLTQYPVFPWVLSDYTLATIDLSDPAVYRDLSKPMGALYREEEFRARYESLAEDADNAMGIKPFHYGTHYSSAGIVLHYLMRIEPFTTHFLRLQGGKFDHADRLFSSVAGAWKSAAGVDSGHNGTQDVKELIPEFFYLPSFLENINKCNFGKDQSGTTVDHVELPPWANGSPREFVRINREALESHYVSANLHHWIDLIFGYAQQGPAAEEACNVFYHLTYEGAVDLDAIADTAMRRAMVDQISEFGQTPSQLFKTPHPPRVRTAHTSHHSEDSNGEGFASRGGTALEHAVVATAPSSGGLSLGTAAGRAALTSSFIEGSDLVSRMHSILTNGSSLGGSSFADDSTVIVDHAATLQQEPRREVGVNCIVGMYRRHHQLVQTSYTPSMVAMRSRQLSSGMPTAPIRQIAIASASVTRDERVAVVSDQCLLIPPRHHEFFAWNFQDRSLKILSTGKAEVATGGESKILACFEIGFAISVACMTSDGRTLIAGGARAAVIRLWHFGSSKKSMLGSSGAGGGHGGTSVGARKRAYSVGLHSGSHNSRYLSTITTLAIPSHRDPITAVQVCRAYGVIVSGCVAGNAVLWDLNRLKYVRTLAPIHGKRTSISSVAINEHTGDIVIASGTAFGVYDVNGELLTRLRGPQDGQYSQALITCLTVNRSEASEWCKEKAVVTGHADGVLCVWAYGHAAGYGDGDVAIELKGRHTVTKSLSGQYGTSRSAITAVLLSNDEKKLYTGNAEGLLSVWTPMAAGTGPTTPSKPQAASPLRA